MVTISRGIQVLHERGESIEEFVVALAQCSRRIKFDWSIGERRRNMAQMAEEMLQMQGDQMYSEEENSEGRGSPE